MKIIIRTLIILVAALVVVAAAVGFAQSSFAVALAPGMPAEQRGAAPVLVTGTETAGAETAGADATGSAAAFTIAGGGFRPDHDGAGGVQGLLPLAKNSAIVALIVGVVALSSQGFDRLRHRRMQLPVR